MVDYNLALARFSLRSSRRDRHRLYRKLQGMLDMNEPLPRAMERLWLNASDGGTHPDKPQAILLREWLQRHRAGQTLSQVMVGSLPDRDLMMIRAGEESGALADALTGIQKIDKAAEGMRAAISQAVSYPLFLIVLLGAVLWLFGVTMIEPMRQSAPPAILAQLGGLIWVSDFIRSYGILTVVLFVGFLFGISATMPIWHGKLRRRFDSFPPWSWFRIWQGSTFLLGLSALLKAQVPLKRSLEILEEQGNIWLKERVSTARKEVMRGKNLGEALRAHNLNFPDAQIALDLEILSERGDVAKILDSLTTEWLDDQTERLKIQAQFVRFIGMAAVAGVIAWAMLSIVGLTQQVSQGMGGGGM